MKKTTLDAFEQKAQEEGELSEAYALCEQFAALHELPTDYIYQEFVDPAVTDLETVFEILSEDFFVVYEK